MLTASELAATYTKSELMSQLASLKTQRSNILTGDNIQSIQTRDLSVTYGLSAASVDNIDIVIRAINKALQILDPKTFGSDQISLRRKFIV